MASSTRHCEQVTILIRPKGPFRLEELATFGFGQRFDGSFDGTMRLAFCVDGFAGHAGVAVTQDTTGVVRASVEATAGAPSEAAVAAQVARVLSLDKDARGYVDVGQRDPVVAGLLAAAPGLRPPLFYSPYEAALWVALSSRRNRKTASTWRARLSQVAGARFVVAGVEMDAVPAPERVVALGAAGVQAATGVEPLRAERVVNVAAAAVTGILDVVSLANLEHGAAAARLRTIPGIGAFYADLILLRATGATDRLRGDEPILRSVIGRLYDLGGPATPAEVTRIAEGWSPWRTWVAVLARAAGPRLLGGVQDDRVVDLSRPRLAGHRRLTCSVGAGGAPARHADRG